MTNIRNVHLHWHNCPPSPTLPSIFSNIQKRNLHYIQYFGRCHVHQHCHDFLFSKYFPPFLLRFSSRSPKQRFKIYSSYRNLSHSIMLFLQICHISQYSDVPYFLCLFRVSQETGKYLIHLAGSHMERHKTDTRIFS